VLDKFTELGRLATVFPPGGQ